MSKKQQYVLGGFVFFLFFTLSLNEFIKQSQTSMHDGRGGLYGRSGASGGDFTDAEGSSSEQRNVASIGSSASTQREIDWEHELANTLTKASKSATKGSQNKIAEKPTLMDQLIFGRLQGRYNVIISQGQVRGIKLKDSEVVGLEIDIAQLFQDYKTMFSPSASQSQSQSQSSSQSPAATIQAAPTQTVTQASQSPQAKEASESFETYTWTDGQGQSHQAKVIYQSAIPGQETSERLLKEIQLN